MTKRQRARLERERSLREASIEEEIAAVARVIALRGALARAQVLPDSERVAVSLRNGYTVYRFRGHEYCGVEVRRLIPRLERWMDSGPKEVGANAAST